MNKYVYIIGILLMSMGLTSCEVIGGIFKAGVWTGIIAVVLVVALIIFLISRMTKK
ncbi:MAG: phosphatidate cytidylyltransferase [Chitinophagaceae bacterium]|nr:phosphatidate cytidylyltransferase [Chitinophagaceae bacterium]